MIELSNLSKEVLLLVYYDINLDDVNVTELYL